MGLMKKAAAALGFRDGGKSRKSTENARAVGPQAQPLGGTLSAPQQEIELPPELRLALLSTDLAASSAFAAAPGMPALWAARSSADGRLGALLASSLRGMGVMTLESPGGSSTGTPTGPTCTGGGHGEAPPSVAGHNPRLTTPALRQSSSHVNQLLGPICTATATPLARQVATRALRKAGDSAPISLPSISCLTGGARLRDAAPSAIQLPGGGAAADGGGYGGGGGSSGTSPPASPAASTSTSTSPRPPALCPSTSHGPSPRMRRSTTLDSHGADPDACQYVPVSASAAAAAVAAVAIGGVATSPSAISADLPAGTGRSPWLQQQQQQPAPSSSSGHDRFSRVTSSSVQDLQVSYGIPEQATGDGDGAASQGEVAAEAGAAASASSLQGANSMPLYTTRLEDSAATAAVALRPVTPVGSSSSRAANPRYATSSQLSFRSHGLTPYSHASQAQIRLPPRRVSDYSMLPVPPDSTLPKLKSVASAMASGSPSASASASFKAPPDAPTAAAATAPAAAAAVAVTAVAENAAAASAEPRALPRPKAMRCINLEPLQPSPVAASGDGAASSSGAGSRSGGARASSQGDRTSGAGLATAATAATESNAVPTKDSIDPSQSQPQPQPHQLSKMAVQTPPRTARILSSPTSVASPFSPLAASAASSSPAAASPSPSTCTTTEPDLPSRPASSAGSPAPPPLQAAAAVPSLLPAPLPHAAAASPLLPPPPQQQLEPLRSMLDEFVPRPSPAQGLLHFSPAAPVQMLRAPVSWGVSDYKVVRKLYAGYASSVYKASCLYSGSDVVLKAYNLAGLSTFLRNQVLRELDIHSRLRHPGAVHLLAAFREGDLLLLVLEYVRGGSLDRVRRKLGGRMTEFQAMHLVLLPLLGVLSYLHERGIVHRDIKPENLLFTESWQLKLCDYGVSICLREERAVTRTGSREYMAPEVNICPLKRGPEDNKTNTDLAYSPAVDVWSLGSLMYELLVGFTPFPGGPPARREGARGSAGAALAFPSSVSQGAREFVRSCLELDSADRPTIHQLTQHPWIQEALEYNASLQSPRNAL